MFSLFQHFVFSLSFFEKNIFFCFFGVYFVFLFFHFFKNYFHFFSGELKYVRVWGLNKAKFKKTCKKSIFFLPNQNVICKYDE